MSERKCEYCGYPIGYCEAGEYCTNPKCTYVDGRYNGPRKISEIPRTFTQSDLTAAEQRGFAQGIRAAADVAHHWHDRDEIFMPRNEWESDTEKRILKLLPASAERAEKKRISEWLNRVRGVGEP